MNHKFSSMTDEEIYKAYMKENSQLIKKYLLKDNEAAYEEQSALLLQKYKGTIVEQLEQQEYSALEQDDGELESEVLSLEQILHIKDANDFTIAYMDYLNDKCEYGEDIAVLTEREKTVYYVDNMNSGVHSKGFKEYLKSDDFPGFELLEQALQTIGANTVCEILKDAKKKPKWTSFDKIDDRFYEYPDNLERLIMNYVKE